RRRDQARIEAGEEAGGPVVLLAGCPDDDDPVGRALLAPRSLGDDLLGERRPQWCPAALCELFGKSLAERGQARPADVTRQRGLAGEGVVALVDVARPLQRA